MAGQSAKKQVASNSKILKEIHLITWGSFVFFAITNFYLRRPASAKPFVLFYIPAVICVLVLERMGRPQLDASGRIIRQGEDLKQEGLTEYLFDIIYVTIFLSLLAFIFNSNKVWWLYIAVPAFVAYKLYAIFNIGKAMFGGGAKKEATQTASQEPQKSKRQQKMEKRGDKPKMRYR